MSFGRTMVALLRPAGAPRAPAALCDWIEGYLYGVDLTAEELRGAMLVLRMLRRLERT